MRGAQAAPGTWLLCLRSDQDQTCSAWSQDGMNLKELEDLRATGLEFLKSHKDVDPRSWWKKKIKGGHAALYGETPKCTKSKNPKPERNF